MCSCAVGGCFDTQHNRDQGGCPRSLPVTLASLDACGHPRFLGKASCFSTINNGASAAPATDTQFADAPRYFRLENLVRLVRPLIQLLDDIDHEAGRGLTSIH